MTISTSTIIYSSFQFNVQISLDPSNTWRWKERGKVRLASLTLTCNCSAMSKKVKQSELSFNSTILQRYGGLFSRNTTGDPMARGWHPKSSSVPAWLSPAHHWVWNQNIFWDPRVPDRGYATESSPLRSRVVISKPNPISILAKPMLPQFLHLIHIGILKYITWRCPVSYLFGNFLSTGNIVLWKWNILASIPFFIMEIRLRMTENCFFGQVIITFMSTGHNFQNSLK